MSKFIQDDDIRWRFLASLTTLLLIGSLVGLLIGASVGVLSLSAIPEGFFLLYATCILTALVWTYGEDALRRFGNN